MTAHTWIAVIEKGDAYAQLGRALWNLIAPIAGEPPCYAPGEQPWPTIDLASSDVVAHVLPHANLNGDVFRRLSSIPVSPAMRKMAEAGGEYIREKRVFSPEEHGVLDAEFVALEGGGIGVKIKEPGT